MQQLTTKEFDIYKNYIFEKIVEKFKTIGSIDMDYLKNVTKMEYEERNAKCNSQPPSKTL